MMNRYSACRLLVALAAASIPTLASASSHREAPAVTEDPTADNTDLYAWVDTDKKVLTIVANYIPFEEPAGGPNFYRFSNNVRYEIHIAKGGSSLEDYITYRLTCNTSWFGATVDPTALVATPSGGNEFFSQLSGGAQTCSMRKLTPGAPGPSKMLKAGNNENIPVAPVNIGPKTNAVAYGIPDGTTYEQFFVDGGGSYVRTFDGGEGRIFLGPRDDPFYVDLAGIFDLAQLRPKGTARDYVAKFNTHAIVSHAGQSVGADQSSAPSP